MSNHIYYKAREVAYQYKNSGRLTKVMLYWLAPSFKYYLEDLLRNIQVAEQSKTLAGKEGL